jgi:hypothetical protein
MFSGCQNLVFHRISDYSRVGFLSGPFIIHNFIDPYIINYEWIGNGIYPGAGAAVIN